MSRGGAYVLREDPFAEAMARWEARIRALNAECAADPFEAGMDHEAEARARHAITGPSRYVPSEPHLAPSEDD